MSKIDYVGWVRAALCSRADRANQFVGSPYGGVTVHIIETLDETLGRKQIIRYDGQNVAEVYVKVL